MKKKLAALAIVLAAGGCRMCSDCCDYSPTTPGGMPLSTVRSGSVLSGGIVGAPEPLPEPAVTSSQPVTPPSQTLIR